MRIKQKPEDFSVKESYRFDEDPDGSYRVYMMDKQKLSTFDAIAILREKFGLRPGAISYCGLKDKQGRTEQLIAVDGYDIDMQEENLRLKYLGRSNEKLSAKNTTSNRFSVTVRALKQPELSALNVYAEQRPPPKKVLVSRESYKAHAEVDKDEGGQVNQPAPGGLRARDEGVSVQLEVPGTATVLGDATPARLAVGTTTMRAQVKLRTAPRLMPYVFRVAEASNQAPFPLLPGPIDLYRRGSFFARYDLERVAKGARFSLTFGVEERVRVVRQTIAELRRDQGVLGPTRRRKFHYQIEVESFLPSTEEIEITEQVPVSELDDVKVGLDGTSPGYDLDKADGLVRWRPKLATGQKQKLDLHFYIDVPAAYDTSGN